MLARIRVAELMDDPGLDPNSHAKALSGLERLNMLSTSADILWTQLKQIDKPGTSGAIRVLDLATGGGDILIALCKRAQACGRAFQFVGADISATAVRFAQLKAEAANVPLSFMKWDALSEKLPDGFDVVMTSLFTHHLDPDQVINTFEKMRDAAAHLVLVNDLVRSRLSLALVWLATRIFSDSAVVHHDGPASVRASYTIDEMQNMAEQAGLHNCSVRFYPPCRQLLIWRREPIRTNPSQSNRRGALHAPAAPDTDGRLKPPLQLLRRISCDSVSIYRSGRVRHE